MNKLKTLLLLVLLFCVFFAKADKISKGYQALKIYNYFEAKNLFEKSLKSKTAPAAFGLSIIYYRNDNPFSNIDSAYKFIILCERYYQSETEKNKLTYFKYGISLKSIDSIKTSIHHKAFEFYKSKNSIADLEKFIAVYVTAPECFSAIDLRNKLAFEDAK
ncbi:MAG: hypothetical protein ACXVPY_15290, partial [Bacteroidia bacterium]